MFQGREALLEQLLQEKLRRGLRFADIAQMIGKTKEGCAAAFFGDMAFSEEEARRLAAVFSLPEGAEVLLCLPPERRGLENDIPRDPILYRLHEMIQVWGRAIHALIQEEFGDGVMSAVDFTLALEKEENPKGDRVRLTLSGKFLPYPVS